MRLKLVNSACNIMHVKLYLSVAELLWFSPYDTIQRVSVQIYAAGLFQHLQSCNTLKCTLQFPSDSHTSAHPLRLLICIETLMDTKIVNYPKRAHEERHERLVALHIHTHGETPDAPHLQLFPTRHKPVFLQGTLGGSKTQSAIESHSHPPTCFLLEKIIL